jgi:two-component system heavy metal sensor histidine kinase CusS
MLERVEESFQRLTNYSADIAHELRTPVANLMTQTQVALTRARSIDEYREVLYSTMEEYERMAQMIGDMLFLAQAENGLFKPDIINVNLEHEISGLFEYYVAWAEERGVTLKLEGHALTVGDRLMLRRALSNLLSNAIRHTPPRQSVRVLLDDSGRNEVTITVENPGLIIAPQHIPRLFDRFYRVDPSRYRDNDGAGLGLAIVKSIIDIHHGTIKVISEQGYTRFYLTLPRFIT